MDGKKMDEVTLYNLHNRGGTSQKDLDRIDKLERSIATLLRMDGKGLREIAKIMDIKVKEVKELLPENLK